METGRKANAVLGREDLMATRWLLRFMVAGSDREGSVTLEEDDARLVRGSLHEWMRSGEVIALSAERGTTVINFGQLVLARLEELTEPPTY